MAGLLSYDDAARLLRATATYDEATNLWYIQGVPVVDGTAIKIVQMCDYLGVTITPLLTAAFMHGVVSRLAKLERDIAELYGEHADV